MSSKFPDICFEVEERSLKKKNNQDIDPIVVRTWARWVIGNDVFPENNIDLNMKNQSINSYLWPSYSYLERQSVLRNIATHIYGHSLTSNNQKRWYGIVSDTLCWLEGSTVPGAGNCGDWHETYCTRDCERALAVCSSSCRCGLL